MQILNLVDGVHAGAARASMVGPEAADFVPVTQGLFMEADEFGEFRRCEELLFIRVDFFHDGVKIDHFFWHIVKEHPLLKTYKKLKNSSVSFLFQ